MCSKHYLRKSVHVTTQLDPQVVSHCKQASQAECARESQIRTQFCRLTTYTVKLNGPNIHNPWPSSMAAPLIFEKHSRRPHGSCVLWCCLRRTAPTRKTTWFAQGPRVVFNFAQGGFQFWPEWFSISNARKSPLPHNQLVQNIHTPVNVIWKEVRYYNISFWNETKMT